MRKDSTRITTNSFSPSRYTFMSQLNTSTSVMKKPENWNKKQDFVFIGQDKTILQTLQTNGYVIPSIPEIYVLSGASPFFKMFREKHEI